MRREILMNILWSMPIALAGTVAIALCAPHLPWALFAAVAWGGVASVLVQIVRAFRKRRP